MDAEEKLSHILSRPNVFSLNDNFEVKFGPILKIPLWGIQKSKNEIII
jgi:hypothetical protein